MKLDFKVIKTQFFDKEIVDHLSEKARIVLSRFGAFVRTTSKQSIRPARRKTDAELTGEERDRFQMRLRLWAQGRIQGKRPTRPLRPSKPGEPPRRRFAGSPIKMIFFLYDPMEQSVTVGPIAFGRRPGEATEALEYGGRTTNSRGEHIQIEARPFMTPAYEKHLPDLARWKATA